MLSLHACARGASMDPQYKARGFSSRTQIAADEHVYLLCRHDSPRAAAEGASGSAMVLRGAPAETARRRGYRA